MTFFPKKWKTVYLQGFWPKSMYLKCFGNQLKTVYLQGPHCSRPCISRPCCTLKLHTLANIFQIKVNSFLLWNFNEKDWAAQNLKISKPPCIFFSFLPTALHRDNSSRFPKLSLSRLCSKARFISCTDSIMKLYIY